MDLAGGVLAVGIWLLASAAFALYVAKFSSYNKTYGALAAIIVFLVWLWISNIALLLGAEFNAELDRGVACRPASRRRRAVRRAARHAEDEEPRLSSALPTVCPRARHHEADPAGTFSVRLPTASSPTNQAPCHVQREQPLPPPKLSTDSPPCFIAAIG